MITKLISTPLQWKPLWASQGSFDPFTNGHLSLVTTMLSRDPAMQWEIIIAKNYQKTGRFTTAENKFIIEQSIPAEFRDRVRVAVLEHGEVVVNYCYEMGINFLVRGIRTLQDFQAETTLADNNDDVQHRWSEHRVETLFLPQRKGLLSNVSSSNFALFSTIGITLEHYAPAFTREIMKMKTRHHLYIGVTGGMHCGKSSLAEAIESYSKGQKVPIHRVDFDTLIHEIYESKKIPRYESIRNTLYQVFGNSIRNDDGTINRQVLGSIVYSIPGGLDKLADIILPHAFMLLGKKINALPPGVLLIESAIFAEKNMTELVDENMIHVVVPESVQRERMAKEFSTDQVERRLPSQYSAKKAQDHILARQADQFDRLFMSVSGELDLTSPDVVSDLYNQICAEYTRRQHVIRADRLFLPRELKVRRPVEFLNSIIQKYRENNLGYHNLEHIQEFITQLCLFRKDMELTDQEFVAFFLAGLIHDIFYQPGTHDNEEKSADIALQLMNTYVTETNDELEHLVTKLIALTAYHGRKPSSLTHIEKALVRKLTEKEKFYLDLDMWILAAPFPRVLSYEKGIYDEYSSCVDRKTYLEKRIGFLKAVLDPDSDFPIFKSEFMRTRFEEKARKNIRALIGTLSQELKSL